MNCQQLRQHIEKLPEDALNFAHFSAEMLAHVKGCVACKNFSGQRRELALGLQRTRAAAPEVPQTLDAAVLIAFRRHLATRRNKIPPHKKTGRLAIFSYSAAVIATAGILILFLLPSEKVVPRIQTVQALQPMVANQVFSRTSKGAPVHGISHSTRNPRKKPKQRSFRRDSPDDHSLLSSGFTSLIYCDRLSCAGDMEIVRVQVSPSMLGMPATRADAASTVLADVLVGPDGIARGIRLEQ